MENKHVVFWGVAALVFLVDRVTKLLVQKYIAVNASKSVLFLSITNVSNTGTAFGLFKGVPWFFTVFAMGVSVYLIVKYQSFEKNMQPLLGLVLGGALGNVVDRLLYGAVIDFIDVHFWPVFNVADAAVSCAVIGLIVLSLYEKRKI